MPAKALLFDVDNTLTTTNRVLRPRTLRAIEQVAQAGYIVGVCTGRSWAELRHKVLTAFPLNALHVVSGGAQVVEQDGTERWGQQLSDQQVRELIFLVETAGGTFIFAQGALLYGSPYEQRRKGSLDWGMAFGDLESLPSWQTHLLCAAHLSPQVEAALLSRKDITIKRMLRQGDIPYVDITPIGVTKATGIEHWCDELGIAPSEVIGFGDSENDREFLQAVGHGIAMGNASPAIKAIADEVIGHTDQDGVAEYLENLIS